MAFAIQVSHNGRTSQYLFDKFAMVGSSPDCHVPISDKSVPPLALTVLMDGANGFRVMVKADGLIINGQTAGAESVMPFRVGTPLQMGSVTLEMVAAATALASVVPPVQRQVLPGVANSPAQPRRTPEANLVAKKPDEGNIALMIAGIVLCVVAIAGILAWMIFGQNSTLASAVNATTLKTIPAMILQLQTLDETTNDLPEWNCGYISRDEVIERLRGAYSLEARGRKSEAKAILRSILLEMQKDIETDENGHFVLLEPSADESNTGETEGKGKSPSKGTTSIVALWFQDKQRQELYDFLARKCSDLDAK